MTLSLILCDDHTLFREGLASLITREPGWQVLAQAADGAEAVHLATALRPDVAVVDLAMPGMNGIDAAASIRVAAPATCIVAVSMYADAHYLQRMMAAGARAYVLKNEAGADLIQAIRARIMMKLRIDTLDGLVRFAIRAGIAPVE